MLGVSDKTALVWACVATVGAAFAARATFAGNAVAVAPSNAGMQYFSVELFPGQRLKTTASGAVQILVDDISYGVAIFPYSIAGTPYVVPVIYQLWNASEFAASYETGGIAGGSPPFSVPAFYTYYSFPLTPPPLPSGRTLNFDVESWSNQRGNPYHQEVQEVDNVGAFVRALDESRQMADFALFARGEHVPWVSG